MSSSDFVDLGYVNIFHIAVVAPTLWYASENRLPGWFKFVAVGLAAYHSYKYMKKKDIL